MYAFVSLMEWQEDAEGERRQKFRVMGYIISIIKRVGNQKKRRYPSCQKKVAKNNNKTQSPRHAGTNDRKQVSPTNRGVSTSWKPKGSRTSQCEFPSLPSSPRACFFSLLLLSCSTPPSLFWSSLSPCFVSLLRLRESLGYPDKTWSLTCKIGGQGSRKDCEKCCAGIVATVLAAVSHREGGGVVVRLVIE
jgi:hypothetical protein